MIFVVAMYLADAIWAAGAGTRGGNGDGGQQFSCPRRGALAAVPVAVHGEEFACGQGSFTLAPAQLHGRVGGEDDRRPIAVRVGLGERTAERGPVAPRVARTFTVVSRSC